MHWSKKNRYPLEKLPDPFYAIFFPKNVKCHCDRKSVLYMTPAWRREWSYKAHTNRRSGGLLAQILGCACHIWHGWNWNELDPTDPHFLRQFLMKPIYSCGVPIIFFHLDDHEMAIFPIESHEVYQCNSPFHPQKVEISLWPCDRTEPATHSSPEFWSPAWMGHCSRNRSYEAATARLRRLKNHLEGKPSMWGPPVISWFISPSNYSYKYHKP